MKRIKKGEIAIYVVSLMLVAAGYFNYVTFENPKTQETYVEEVNNIDDKYANVGDAVLVSNNEVENNDNEKNTTNEVAEEQIKEEGKKDEVENEAEKKEDNQNDGTKKEENKNDENQINNYYVSSKLDRDKMYAESISNYEKIINNSNASEAQKSIATQEITKINNTKNAIMISENLIQTKGFDNCLILINDSSVNVVVHIKNGLDKEAVAKIQNIVSREIKVDIDNIHITEK